MGKSVKEYLVWALLNVLVPGGAAIFTFTFTAMFATTLPVDALMQKAFAGADNLVVSAVLFAVLYFEVQPQTPTGTPGVLVVLIEWFALFFAIVSTVLFGAFKGLHLSDAGPNYRFPEVHHAGALVSVGMLSIACCAALFVKLVLMASTPRR